MSRVTVRPGLLILVRSVLVVGFVCALWSCAAPRGTAGPVEGESARRSRLLIAGKVCVGQDLRFWVTVPPHVREQLETDYCEGPIEGVEIRIRTSEGTLFRAVTSESGAFETKIEILDDGAEITIDAYHPSYRAIMIGPIPTPMGNQDGSMLFTLTSSDHSQ